MKRDGITITITGHPGAGKTTLANEIERCLLERGFDSVDVLDSPTSNDDSRPAKQTERLHHIAYNRKITIITKCP